MPNVYNFSNIETIKNVSITPNGWITPIVIQFGINEHSSPTYYWRVKGTQHTFTIPVSRMNYISSGDYAKHFTEVLEKFKTNDYDEWRKIDFAAPWMREYEREYKRYIL